MGNSHWLNDLRIASRTSAPGIPCDPAGALTITKAGWGMAEGDEDFYRYQAERCRWLARNSNEHKTIMALHNMAREYDKKAAALAAQAGPESSAA